MTDETPAGSNEAAKPPRARRQRTLRESLGSIVLGEWRETTVPLSLISPAWFRANMVDFLAVCKDTPFFFAWRSGSYPQEVLYGWTSGDATAVQQTVRHMTVKLDMDGVA